MNPPKGNPDIRNYLLDVLHITESIEKAMSEIDIDALIDEPLRDNLARAQSFFVHLSRSDLPLRYVDQVFLRDLIFFYPMGVGGTWGIPIRSTQWGLVGRGVSQ